MGLFRTELQFLTEDRVPRRGDLAATYARVMDAAKGSSVYINRWTEDGAKPYDLAAGTLIVRAAGGDVVALDDLLRGGDHP